MWFILLVLVSLIVAAAVISICGFPAGTGTGGDGFISSASQVATLRSICDTIFASLRAPSLDEIDPFRKELLLSISKETLDKYYATTASEMNVPHIVIEKIRTFGNTDGIKAIKLLLTLLDSKVGSFLMTFEPVRFADQSFEKRQAVMLSWSRSRNPIFRKAFKAFKEATAFVVFSICDVRGQNPTWSAIQYPGIPAPLKEEEYPLNIIKPEIVTGDTTYTCDVVVIGSGAGGGVVAGELAEAGFQVIVLEKGPFVSEREMTSGEDDGVSKMYEAGALLSTEDGNMALLAGSCIGGGTTVNWSASFRTPDYIRKEWSQEHGLTDLETSEYTDAMDAVWSINGTRTDLAHNVPNQILRRGCESLGYHHTVIARNVSCEHDSGGCQFGCRHGYKQSTMRTWLQTAAKHQAQFIVNCYVDRIDIDPITHVASSVECTVRDVTTSLSYKVHVSAGTIVVSAGAIHTPAILLRSGLKNPNIGQHLQLHPVSAVSAVFKEKVETFKGAPMSIVSDEIANLDGKHHGVKIETAPTHPGLVASIIPWYGAAQFKTDMLLFPHLSIVIGIARDTGSGHITIDSTGHPRIHYSPNDQDRQHLQTFHQYAATILVAAGARDIGGPHKWMKRVTLPANDNERAQALEKFITEMRAQGMNDSQVSYFSAHQMSSCRMGRSAATSVCDIDGRVWDHPNLYIADASLFPTASGVNPMVTVQSLSYFVARRLIKTLQAQAKTKAT